MIDIYKLIKGISVKLKVGSNDDSEMVSQFSSSTLKLVVGLTATLPQEEIRQDPRKTMSSTQDVIDSNNTHKGADVGLASHRP